MEFDPEKVARHQGFLATQHDRTGDEMWVTTDDYDQLLELYRKELHRAESYALQYGE